MTPTAFEKAICDRIPPDAIAYCTSIFKDQPFYFKISRNRKSKSGDYRFDKNANSSIVTVNSGLNQYSILITLIHEIAHHTTRLKYGQRVKPHGKEWKHEFRNLMIPLVNPMVFPEDLLRLLSNHLKNPKASTWSDARLAMTLRKYNPAQQGRNEYYLDELIEGNTFTFNNRSFTKLKKRRTRVLCQDCSTGRKYLIPGQAVVKVI